MLYKNQTSNGVNYFLSRFFVGFLIIVIVVLAVYIMYKNLLSPDHQLARQLDVQQKAVEAFVKRYEDAMRADTYGGKTPEETLQMFIAALQKGDIELASKYFMLDTNENSQYYLTREPRIVKQLYDFKEQNKLDKLLSYLSNTQPSADFTSPGEASYRIYEMNQLISIVVLRLNKYSSVWKISSL